MALIYKKEISSFLMTTLTLFLSESYISINLRRTST